MEAIESIYMHQPPTLDKFPYCLGFDTQPPDETPSFSSEPILQNPIRNPLNGDVDDDDDGTTLQIIVEEVRNLVISRAFSEEIKAKSENEDEIMLQIMNEEVLNLVLNKAVSEDRAKGNGRDGVGSESVKEISENEYCGDRYEEGDGSWSECGNVIDVENEKGGEAGSKEWGFDRYEEGDRSWMGNENVIDVENEKGVEVGSREWGFDHYGDGDRSWRGNENVVDVENDKGGEEGLKEWGFDRYEEGDRSWRGNENVVDMENEKGGEAGLKEWGFDRYEEGDRSWRGNENMIDMENEKGGEAGLKEWRFNANGRGLIYPLRPDAEDCAYYLKTGTCKYGVSCKFNHPSPRRNQQWAMEKCEQKEESEERAGLIECKYYLTEGGCKYGNACKYNHSRRKGAISPVMDFNFLGLPIRPGEKDCPYYMRTGSCKYGSNCRFHHPDPTTVAGNNPSFGYNYDLSAPVQSASYSPVSSWSSPQASNETAPFVPMVYSASQGIPPLGPQWNSFQAPVYPTPEKSLPTPPVFTMKDPATKTNFYPRPQQPWLVEEYPERPGQPDCSYFLKTGDCKYKSNCKFHHPKTQKFKTNLSVLSDKGLPLRPGQAVCSFYSRCGICKFGPACKFDHPEHNDNSAASPGFAFYQPPFGNSATTDGLRMGRKGNGNGSLVQPSI